ncbi:glycoside hydrolase domain-containing protein [Herbidospora yilanensis]|uniref:glycoside hydrolase domain-containing protein n=1 Tax=Herbidospora yilanensis TaxID=354426 RepID=UPI000783DCDA|nr:glycoside hydrolase domain-containing protein [Herbidospora yilanensis]
MDHKVLAAQRWVNATYAEADGYVRCREDGVTGWATMGSLTRALQIELGLPEVDGVFGADTLAGVGVVGTGSTRMNVVQIIQHGLFCKGYWGGDQAGVYDSTTDTSVRELKADAGLGAADGDVPPKIFKAILTMDAYVIVAGGTGKVRAVQQWLNLRYTDRANFFVIPCDGIFSRDVQRALYLAVQFELGMSDAQAGGNFGPGTRDGLRGHPLAPGDTGIWVRILSAACVFNGRVPGADGLYREAEFTETFDAGLAGYLRAFQEFSELPVTGTADYATWCQLLVSTGDPDRPGAAADCMTTVTAERARALWDAGYRIVGRYLDERPSAQPLHKQIQPGELATIFGGGLRVFPISQYSGKTAAYFTHTQGYLDALGAHAAAAGHGFDAGTVIYFAVDFDATRPQITSNVIPYFKGVVGGLAHQGKRYVHGVYGSRNVCAQVTRETFARWSFVSGMSSGFSGNMGFALPENWSFNQIQTLWVGAGAGRIQIDKNVRRTAADPGVSSVGNPVRPAADFVTHLAALHGLAVAYGGGDPNRLVLEFLRHEDYDDVMWRQLIGGVDEGFVRFVKNAGVTPLREFTDPFHGIGLKVSHLAAACNAVHVAPPPLPIVAENGSDVAGWGGDLMTFYGEWRRDSGSYASGYTYCAERLAKPVGEGTFKLRDLVEDADAYNLAVRVRSGESIAQAAGSYYLHGGHVTRFAQFYENRFMGEPETVAKLARRVLTDDVDPVISLGRAYLIETTGGVPTIPPFALPAAMLDAFVSGFVATLLARVEEENPS